MKLLSIFWLMSVNIFLYGMSEENIDYVTVGRFRKRVKILKSAEPESAMELQNRATERSCK